MKGISFCMGHTKRNQCSLENCLFVGAEDRKQGVVIEGGAHGGM